MARDVGNRQLDSSNLKRFFFDPIAEWKDKEGGEMKELRGENTTSLRIPDLERSNDGARTTIDRHSGKHTLHIQQTGTGTKRDGRLTRREKRTRQIQTYLELTADKGVGSGLSCDE